MTDRRIIETMSQAECEIAEDIMLLDMCREERADALARAKAAEAEAVDSHRQLAEMAAAMEEIEDARLALLARVAELEAALGGLDALAPDYELPDGAAVAMAIGNGQILTAGRHAIHSAVMSVIDSNRDNEALRARVAELEAQLAAQQWQPVTEEPIEDEYYLTYDALLPGNEPWIVNYYSRTQGWANCCSAWLCPPPKPPPPHRRRPSPSK